MLYLPQAQSPLKIPPVPDALLGGLGLAVSTSRPFEAAHFAVTMTTLVGSQPSEAQFSKRKKGWLTSLTEWQPAEKMVCWLNNHSVFFLGSSNYVNSETVSINCPIRHLVIMPLQKYPESWWQGLGA